MTDSIDYEALFKQVRSENEGLRLVIVKLKNSTPTFFEGVVSWIEDFVADESNKQIMITFSVIIFVSLIIPAIRSISRMIIRRFTNER